MARPLKTQVPAKPNSVVLAPTQIQNVHPTVSHPLPEDITDWLREYRRLLVSVVSK